MINEMDDNEPSFSPSFLASKVDPMFGHDKR